MRWIIPMFVLVLTGCSTVPTSFTPTNPLGPGEFSHRLLGQVVASHVKDGVVDYPGIQADDRFPAYLAMLDRVDPNALPTRTEQLAFWINAYNAFAVKGILDRYSPVTYVGRYRYFIGRDYRVGGATINLYDLERRVLIKQFQEPLIHFAIVCASTSCPKLQPWTYEPDQLDRQLDRVAREFINDATRNRFDRTKKIASLSMIFKWFEDDFAKAAGSVPAYIARYVSDPELVQDLMHSDYRIEYLDYDWSLNGIPPRETTHAGQS
ncbi:MAG: hypothetical protein A4E19_11020 [Nitrospira sp. SG-bin1]|nr:MAG: hypothetical protein A4E19_11020 [Nitrospira sp. SG-bin1]